MSRLFQDLRFAIRALLRRPGFSFVTALTVALGVGATVAIFTVVNGVLLRPLPYHDSDELVTVGVDRKGGPGDIMDYMSPPDVADLAAQSPALATLIGYQGFAATLIGFGEPALVEVARVSEGLLETFHLRPVLGRDLRPEEAVPNAAPVALISYGFWRDRLGMSLDAVGETIELGGARFEVVGIAPEGFDFPARTQVWFPHRINPESCGRRCHTWRTIGRLAPGATVASAQAEARAIAARLSNAYPESNFQKDFLLMSLQDRVVGDVRAALWVLLGAVGSVLLIACANVANLLLIRASTRTGEVAVRAALGASRGRLTTQILVESGVLAAVGGAGGLVLAALGVEVLRLTSAGTIPRVSEIAIDGTVILVALGLVLAVTLLFGLSPAAYLARVPLSTNLVHASRGSDTAPMRRRSRSLLLGLEIALSVILLTGAGLLLRSFGKLYAVELGFETHEIVRFTLSQSGELDEVRTFYRTLEERIGALPGVESVGSVFGAPLGTGHTTAIVEVDGRPEPAPGQETYAGIRSVSPRYLETARIPLLRGRTLDARDDISDAPVAVVNQAFVRENFPNEEPLGQQVRVKTDQGYGSPQWTIVGIVGDIRAEALTREPLPEIYVPHGQFGPGYMTVTIRGIPGFAIPLSAVRTEVHSLDPRLPLRSIETMTDAVRREVAPTRFYLVMMSLFAALAVILAAIGLYGVLAYLVSRRTREIGLRVAFGARQREIVRMVVWEGLRPVLLGALAGLVVSSWGARVLETLLYNVTSRDPWTFTIVPAVLILTALVAMLIPARRATRVDPVKALGAE